MKLAKRINQWRQAQTGCDEELIDHDSSAWLLSLLTHFLLLVGATFAPYLGERPNTDLTLIIPEHLDEEVVELQELAPTMAVFAETQPEIGALSAGDAHEAPLPEMSQIAPMENLAALGDEATISEPVAMVDFSAGEGRSLLDHVTGTRGAVVHGVGDAGSVDRITQEILTRLESSPVLVVWLMDASGSLALRRERIIQHFDRVYEELGELAQGENQILLTSIAAFGEKTSFLTPEPTSDRPAIQQAVREIAADESGVENVFSAVKATALEYARYSREGRHLMLVIVTDEKGDDLPVLDEALRLLKQQRASAYVMGPLAPFGREQLDVKWKDEKSGEEFLIPVDRGPETLHVEHARLAIWKDGPGSQPLSSGFGPFGLMRVTHENGGLYLAQNNGDLGDLQFDPNRLNAYRPDYVAADKYVQLAVDSPMRTAVVRTAEATNQRLGAPPPTKFLAAGIQFDIRGAQKRMREIADTLDRGLQELNAVQERRGKERSPRWLANYDLLVGRLLANRVRCASQTQLLDDMYRKPRAPEDGVSNAWELVGDETTRLAQGGASGEASDESSQPSEPRAADEPSKTPTNRSSRISEAAEAARVHLQRVIDEHPGTPWAALAQQELEFPLGFQWRESFIDPPEGVPLPWDKVPWDKLTPAQKTAKENFEKRKAAKRQRQAAAAVEKPAPRPAPPKL